MLWAIKALMFTVFAAAGLLLVFSFSDLFARRWKLALKRFATAIAAALLGIAAMPVLGGLYTASVSESAEPAENAYSLGTAIKDQINFAASGLPVGLLLGFGITRYKRQRRQALRGRPGERRGTTV